MILRNVLFTVIWRWDVGTGIPNDPLLFDLFTARLGNYVSTSKTLYIRIFV